MGIENRGFGSMDKDRARVIASMGGKAAWAKGTANRWTVDTASVAGRKGVTAKAAKRAAAREAEEDAKP